MKYLNDNDTDREEERAAGAKLFHDLEKFLVSWASKNDITHDALMFGLWGVCCTNIFQLADDPAKIRSSAHDFTVKLNIAVDEYIKVLLNE
jgi:hypothetical protein